VKLFLDTAFVEEIKAAKEWGILDGVTTNPTLVAKTGKGFMEVVQDILEYGGGASKFGSGSSGCTGYGEGKHDNFVV